jgi:hypothetical protein
MRWRNGLMVCVDCVIALLLSQNEADCLIPQHRKQSLWLSEPTASDQAANYRGSGLVVRPTADKKLANTDDVPVTSKRTFKLFDDTSAR